MHLCSLSVCVVCVVECVLLLYEIVSSNDEPTRLGARSLAGQSRSTQSQRSAGKRGNKHGD